jgi:hypothetical protein
LPVEGLYLKIAIKATHPLFSLPKNAMQISGICPEGARNFRNFPAAEAKNRDFARKTAGPRLQNLGARKSSI